MRLHAPPQCLLDSLLPRTDLGYIGIVMAMSTEYVRNVESVLLGHLVPNRRGEFRSEGRASGRRATAKGNEDPFHSAAYVPASCRNTDTEPRTVWMASSK